MRLKKHESPRKQGRNSKGKLGAARAKQLRERNKKLRAKLKRGGRKPSFYLQNLGDGC